MHTCTLAPSTRKWWRTDHLQHPQTPPERTNVTSHLSIKTFPDANRGSHALTPPQSASLARRGPLRPIRRRRPLQRRPHWGAAAWRLRFQLLPPPWPSAVHTHIHALRAAPSLGPHARPDGPRPIPPRERAAPLRHGGAQGVPLRYGLLRQEASLRQHIRRPSRTLCHGLFHSRRAGACRMSSFSNRGVAVVMMSRAADALFHFSRNAAVLSTLHLSQPVCTSAHRHASTSPRRILGRSVLI